MCAVNAPAPATVAQPPRLLEQLRESALARFGRPEPAERHVAWVRRFILFHGKRHPRELTASDAGRFLQHLAQSEKDPLGCIEQAREALEFLYRDCLSVLAGGVGVCVCRRLQCKASFAVSPGAEQPSAPVLALFLQLSGVLP